MTGQRHPRFAQGVACGLVLLLGPPRVATAAPADPLLPEPKAPPTEPRGPLALPASEAAAGELPPLPADPLAGPRRLGPSALVKGEEDAYGLYMQGQRLLEAGELPAAERSFAAALLTLPDERPYARSRGSLALWWVRCHVALFERTGDLDVLEREEAILEAYSARLDQIAVSPEDRVHKLELVQQRREEIAAVRSLRASAEDDLETQLHAKHEGVQASTWRPDLLEDLGWYPRPDDPRDRAAQVVADDEPEPEVEPEPERTRRPGVGLVVGGALSLAAGVAGMSAMGVGMVRAVAANDFDAAQSPMERREQIVRGIDANNLVGVSAAVGGAFLVAGIVMTVVGAKRMKAGRGSERAPRVTLGPWGLRGRF